MTKPTLRIIIALAIVCCAGAMIVSMHHPDEDGGSETGNVAPTGSDLPEDIRHPKESGNETSKQVPEGIQEVENMTPEEISKNLYASIYGPRIVKQALKEANMTPEELPHEVEKEMKNTVPFEDIIEEWELDPQNKQVVIHAVSARNEEHEKELSAVQGKQASGWTFNVVWEPYVPKLMKLALKKANMAPEELPDEVKEEMENIRVQIGGIRKWELDPQNKLVVTYAHFTWPNEKYENELNAVQDRQVSGWTFHVIREPYVPELMQQTLKEANMTPEELPEELIEEIEHLRHYKNREFGISRWEFDSENKLAIIYAYSILDEKKVKAIQGRQIGGWTLKVIHDVDYENERKQVSAELMQFQKDHPELEISGFIITSPTRMEMWVHNRTPENEALNGTVMYGRTIELIGGTSREELMMWEELKRNEPASREPETG